MKATLTIPEPCHEDWGRMEDAGAGRFCQSCQHTVMDLSRHSDAQLLALLQRDAMPKCARFSRTQLDRVIALDAPSGPRLLPAAVLGSALALQAPAAVAQEQQPAAPPPSVVEMELGEVDVLRYVTRGIVSPAVDAPLRCAPTAIPPMMPEEAPSHASDPMCATITGRVIDEHGDALPFANIFVSELKLGTVSAMDGSFRLVVPDSLGVQEISLSVSFVGFNSRRFNGIPLPRSSEAQDPPAIVEGAALTVRILTDSPEDLAGLSVQLNGGEEARKPDPRGFVAYADPGSGLGSHAVLVRDASGVLHRKPVPQEALPCCVLVDLRSTANAGQGAAALSTCKVELGDVVLRQAEAFILGYLVPHTINQKPTAWSRATRPFRWMWWKARKAFS